MLAGSNHCDAGSGSPEDRGASSAAIYTALRCCSLWVEGLEASRTALVGALPRKWNSGSPHSSVIHPPAPSLHYKVEAAQQYVCLPLQGFFA